MEKELTIVVTMDEYATHLSAWLEKRNMKQSQLASLSGVSKQLVSNILLRKSGGLSNAIIGRIYKATGIWLEKYSQEIDELRRWIIDHDTTQAGLAEMCGISSSAVNDMCRGVTLNFSEETADRVYEVTGIKIPKRKNERVHASWSRTEPVIPGVLWTDARRHVVNTLINGASYEIKYYIKTIGQRTHHVSRKRTKETARCIKKYPAFVLFARQNGTKECVLYADLFQLMAKGWIKQK